MKISRCTLLRCSVVALLGASTFCVFAVAGDEITSKKPSELPHTSANLPGEETLSMRSVLNNFSHALNDWYTSVQPHLQKFQSVGSSYLHPSALKLPGIAAGGFYPFPVPIPQMSAVPAGAGGNSTVSQLPTVPSYPYWGAVPSKPAKNGTEAGTVENADAQAALVTALNSFHQYVDNFINHLSAKLMPYLVHYTPAPFFHYLPTAVPIPIPSVPAGSPGHVMPSGPTACPPGDARCPAVTEESPRPRVPLPIVPSSPDPEVDMSAIIELLGRFGGRLSPSNIVTLQPFMEQYLGRLSASSKAALKPLLSQYWPQLFPPTTEGPAQPDATPGPDSESTTEGQGGAERGNA